MSINYFSPNSNPLWTTSQRHHHQELLQPLFMETTTTSNNLKPHKNGDHDNDDSGQEYLREPMFEKPLTPSDVGKLNRLVIPKQHAEKYFPLHDSNGGSSGGGGGGGGGGDKGMLLSFEDESGRCWRFRYSYWSSSQSYVLTKGWSKYVKDKGLDAGDVVLFERLRHAQQRHQSDGDKLFIGWRRRGVSAAAAARDGGVDMSPVGASVIDGGGGWTSGFYNTHHSYPAHLHQVHPIYSHSGHHAVQSQTMPIVGNSRRLRLFGVNLEFQAADESEPFTPEGSSSSTYPDPMHQQFYF